MSDITKVHEITLEQAQMLIGREIVMYDDDGDSFDQGVAAFVHRGTDDRVGINTNTDGICLGCGDGFHIGVIGALPWVKTSSVAVDAASSDPAALAALGLSETLTQKAERLRAELADVEAEIAREGLPKGLSWYKDYGAPGVQGTHDGTFYDLSYSNSKHTEVYVECDEDYFGIPAAMLFAWVDRVREETPE